MSFLAAAQPGATSGIIPVVTAIGGVAVSIFTVYKNAQKQAEYTGVNTGHIQSLSEQIGMLHAQVNELKAENAALTTELRIFKEQQYGPKKKKKK